VKWKPQESDHYDMVPPEKRLSWLYSIRPFIDQQPYFGNPTKPWDDDENLHLEGFLGSMEPNDDSGEWIPMGIQNIFECPLSTSETPRDPYRPNVCHFIGIAGSYPRAAFDMLGSSGIGMFGYDRETRLEDIKDGASSTLMVVESACDNGMWTAGGKATVRGLEDPTRMPYGGKEGPFRNAHSQSINALFADVSVRTLSRDLNPRVFEAMATIADGDEVPGF
jgi:hypothetical protein